VSHLRLRRLSAFTKSQLADGAVRLWPLWDAYGSATAVELANAKTGTVQGSASFGNLGPLAARRTQGLYFHNADTDNVLITDDLTSITGAVTFEALLYLDTLTMPGGGYRMWYSPHTAVSYVGVSGAGSPVLAASLSIAAAQQICGGTKVFAINTWYLAHCTWASGDKIRTYVSGALDAESASTYSGALSLGSGATYLGKYYNGTTFQWSGMIAAMAVYPSQLSLAQIQARQALLLARDKWRGLTPQRLRVA
jgi:hypothetical protein